MSTKQLAQGATKPGNGSQSAVKPETTPAPTAKVTPIKLDEQKQDKLSDMPPVEDRIHKVNQLFSLVEKHETLLETKKKLKAFKLSTDGSRDTLRIQDGKGNEFITSNSAVIADVLEVLKVSLDKKIVEVEALIKF
jgi:hypothetical protein